MRKHVKRLSWENVVRYQNVSLSFLQEFERKVSFKILSLSEHVSEEVLTYYQDRLNWKDVSRCAKFSVSVIQKWIHLIDIKQLKKNENLSLTKEEWEEIKILKQSIS